MTVRLMHILRSAAAGLVLVLILPGGILRAQDAAELKGSETKPVPATLFPDHLENLADSTVPSPSSAPASGVPGVPVRATETKPEGFHWGPAIAEELFFTSFMHGKRLAFDPDTAPELKGPLLKDYIRSIEGLHGWDDNDPFQVQYIGHSFHGAVDERIYFQNSPTARDLGWGAPGYWHSRLIGAAWSTLWGAQFKIGPYSEAMIGNVGLPNQYRKRPIPPGANYGIMAWSEFVVNPVGGTAWVISEDLLDRYVSMRMEGHVNRYFMYIARSFLTPSRTWANMLRFKRPWYRENRDIYGRPVTQH